MRESRHARIPPAAVVFAVCLVVYLVLFLLVPRGQGLLTATTGDEPHFLIVTQSILNDGDLAVTDEYNRQDYRKAGYFDRSGLDQQVTPGADGRLVPLHQVLTSVLMVPGFAIAGWRGAGVTMCLFMALAAMLTFLILRRFVHERAAAAAVVFFFLTYPLLLYSHLIYSEIPALLFLVLGVWTCLNVRAGGSKWYLLVAGLCASALPQLHVKYGILSLGLLVLSVIAVRDAIRNDEYRRSDYASLALFLVPLVASLVFLLVWTRYLYGPDILHGLGVSSRGGGMAYSSRWGMFGMYLDRYWGLLSFAPLYLAFVAGTPLPRRRDELVKWWFVLPVTIAVYSIATGSFVGWLGGAAPVPRYLVPVMPFLALAAAVAILAVKKFWVKVVVVLLALAQLVLTVFARICPAATVGLNVGRNELYHKFLGPLSGISKIFPLLHPVAKRSLAELVVWLVFFALLIYARRFYLVAAPGDLLRDKWRLR